MNTFSKNRWRWRSVCLIALGLWWGVLLAGAAVMPDAMQGKARIVELRAEIAHHDELYFKQSAPEISDYDYDLLKRELRRLEQLYPELVADADQAVGDDRSGDAPAVSHAVPMLSLNKSYDEEELRSYCMRVERQLGRSDLEWVLEPKYDGLAISVTYEQGHFVRASTRGNGREGDDVTANVRQLRGLPMQLHGKAAAPVPDVVELRGEVYLAYADFNRINAEREADGLELYAHPRNLAAGTLKQSDPDEVARRRLSIVFYGWGTWSPETSAPATQLELHQRVRDWGLPSVRELRAVHGFAEIWQGVQDFQNRRAQWRFPADGVVLKLNDVRLRAQLGSGPAAPNWAIAYKYAPAQAVTRLRDIKLQIGRTGLVTPVAEFDAVTLDGTTVTRASLHNRDFIGRLDLRIGDWVRVEKAGEVVPQIAGVELTKRQNELPAYVFPAVCPECHTTLVAVPGEAAVRCPNAACPAQVRRGLEHFASTGGVDIKGLGPAMIDALVAAGEVKTPADFYRLDRSRLGAVTGDKAAVNLLRAIERSRTAPLWRFIAGLGIPRVGPATARLMAKRFHSLAAVATAKRENFVTADGASALPGVGSVTANAAWEWLSDENRRRLVTELVAVPVTPAGPIAEDGPLRGKRFVLTGTLPTLSRTEAKRLITDAGGEVRSSVSRQTDYVVAGDGAGGKLEQAKRLGVPVIGEADLREMVIVDE